MRLAEAPVGTVVVIGHERNNVTATKREDGTWTENVTGTVMALDPRDVSRIAYRPDCDVARRVWCVAYDDPTPAMDGPRRIRMGEWATRSEALAALRVVEARSPRAEKRNLGIETRRVSEWEAD